MSATSHAPVGIGGGAVVGGAAASVNTAGGAREGGASASANSDSRSRGARRGAAEWPGDQRPGDVARRRPTWRVGP